MLSVRCTRLYTMNGVQSFPWISSDGLQSAQAGGISSYRFRLASHFHMLKCPDVPIYTSCTYPHPSVSFSFNFFIFTSCKLTLFANVFTRTLNHTLILSQLTCLLERNKNFSPIIKKKTISNPICLSITHIPFHI